MTAFQFYIVSIILAKWLKGRRIKTWGVIIGLFMLLDFTLERAKGLYLEIVYILFQCNLITFQ